MRKIVLARQQQLGDECDECASMTAIALMNRSHQYIVLNFLPIDFNSQTYRSTLCGHRQFGLLAAPTQRLGPPLRLSSSPEDLAPFAVVGVL